MLSSQRVLWLTLLLILPAASAAAQKYKCLPTDIAVDRVVSVNRVPDGGPQGRVESVTVKQSLDRLHARCSGKRLVDKKGKEIRFYRLQGCWGNPPANYLEIMRRQREDLERLKSQYTLIEITCNPSGYPIPASRPGQSPVPRPSGVK